MNKRIWKSELKIKENQIIEMPVNAEILTVQTQFRVPCIWALINPKEKKENRVIEIYDTGDDIHCNADINRKYIGTFQLRCGSLIHHVFECIKKEVE